MRIISRYVFRQAGGSLLLILLSLSGVVWIALALRQLNLVTSQGQDTLTFLKMTTLALPNLMAIIAPFSFLIAAIHTLNRLNSDSELIVLTASGSTLWTVGRPLLFLALLVSAFIAFVNHFGQPWSLRQLRAFIIEVRTDLLTQVIQPGRFSSPETNLTFHIKDRAANGDLLGFIMHDTRDKKQSQSYLAERGVIVKQDQDSYLVMVDGNIVRRNEGDDPPEIIAFDKYAVNLDRFEKKDDGGADDLKPRERYLNELMNPEPESRQFKAYPGQFRAELHERFASPLYPLAFAMIVLAFMGRAQSIRQARNEKTILAFICAAGCRLGGLALNNVVTIKAAAIPVLYLIPAGALLLALIAIALPSKKRSGPTPLDRLSGAAGAAKSMLARLFAHRRASAEGPPL